MTKDEPLKLALETLESSRIFVTSREKIKHPEGTEWYDQTITTIKEALAQTEQEPVAWMFQHDETGRMNYVSNDGIHDPTMFLGMNPRYALVCPLYTTPPHRPWVGLTDDEMYRYCPIWLGQSDFKALIFHIESKLKDKNTRGQE
jgi:hypothetical protein